MDIWEVVKNCIFMCAFSLGYCIDYICCAHWNTILNARPINWYSSACLLKTISSVIIFILQLLISCFDGGSAFDNGWFIFSPLFVNSM